MRKIWITSEAMPASAETLAEAQALGAGEIVHRPLPSDLADFADGYHEIAGPEDAPPEEEP